MARTLGYLVCGAAGIAGVCFAMYLYFTTHEPGETAVPAGPAIVLILSLVLLGAFGYGTADSGEPRRGRRKAR